MVTLGPLKKGPAPCMHAWSSSALWSSFNCKATGLTHAGASTRAGNNSRSFPLGRQRAEAPATPAVAARVRRRACLHRAVHEWRQGHVRRHKRGRAGRVEWHRSRGAKAVLQAVRLHRDVEHRRHRWLPWPCKKTFRRRFGGGRGLPCFHAHQIVPFLGFTLLACPAFP
jgi:hypothetical protein